MDSPHSPGNNAPSIDDIESVHQNVAMSIAGPSRTRSPAVHQSHGVEASDPSSAIYSQKPEQQVNGSTPSFNINLSTENDRIALTRYTHQALTSLAAYRDALIDENGRLNAMIARAQAGLQLSNDDLETELLVDAGSDRYQRIKTRRIGQRKQPSVANIVRDGMKEELDHLRNKAAQLKQQEESIQGANVGGNSEVAVEPVSPQDPTLIMYYTIVNKLQSDLNTSKGRRADAIAALATTSRRRPEKIPRRSRTAEHGIIGKDSSLYGKSGHALIVSQSPSQRNGTRATGGVRNTNSAASQAQIEEPVDIESILPLLTDQEEAVWQRERRESEMEKALRDLRCYVETMMREWRDIGDLPPPGKYQTISYPDLNLPYIPTQIFPKRKGRPPRTSVKVQQIPEGLQHLLAGGRTTRVTEKIEKTEKTDKDRRGGGQLGGREKGSIRNPQDPPLTACQIADALVARRNRERQAKARAFNMDDLNDPARKRRRMLVERHMEYADDSAGSVPTTTRNGSITGSHTGMLHVAANSPDHQNQPLSPDQLYGATASAISDAMQAYTQPLQDETSVFGPAEDTYESPEESYDTQIPYQVQLAQRRSLGFAADLNVPETLVNGGNVFDNPDDVQLGAESDRQTEHQHGSATDFAQSNPFPTYHQEVTQESVEGLIQQHIRNAQASEQQPENTLMQLEHVDAASLEVSDAQQALDQYRFEEALLDHDMNETEGQQSNSIMATGENADSENATAIAAQRLMNSLAPQADPEFDTACQNCGRRDTSAWRKLTVNGVDYKVCNACGLHYQKNGVMRPRSMWGDVAAEPRRRRSQRPFGSLPSDQTQHDMLMDDALYPPAGEEEGEEFAETSTYDGHFPEGQYGLDGQAALTADSPQYELNLGQ